MSLYMVIEKFRNGDALPVYRRFRDRGRLAPAGLSYVSSWVNHKLDRCYQLMEAEDPALLDQWIANWSDIVDFEVRRVISCKEATEKISPQPFSGLKMKISSHNPGSRNRCIVSRLSGRWRSSISQEFPSSPSQISNFCVRYAKSDRHGRLRSEHFVDCYPIKSKDRICSETTAVL